MPDRDPAMPDRDQWRRTGSGQTNALMPVMARPTIKVLISRVP